MSESPEHNKIRASDADRERVARVLYDAMAEGRLTVAEVDERLAGLYQSKTVGELAQFTKDLPAPQVNTAAPISLPTSPSGSELIGGMPTSTSEIAILSGADRKGDWVVPTHFSAFSFWGEVKLDLREARFETAECTIQAVAIMAGVDIIVPPELTVYVQGVGIMGVFDRNASGQGMPGSPVLRVTGTAFWGEVKVIRKPRKFQRKRLNG